MTTVLVLGAGRTYVATIRALNAAGFRVVVTDRDANAPGFSVADHAYPCDIVDVDEVAKIATAEAVDGILPLNDLGVRTAALACHKVGLPGLSPDVVPAITKKHEMRRRWREGGVRNPVYFRVNGADAIREAAAQIGYPVILKPADGILGGQRGVIAVRDESELDAATEEHLTNATAEGSLVEEMVIADSEHSAEVLIEGDRVTVIAIGDKEKTPLPYRVDKAVIYPTALSAADRRTAEAAIAGAVIAFGLTLGAAHVEFAMRGGEAIFFELGARTGGGATAAPIVPWTSGVPYVELAAKLHCGIPVGPVETTRNAGSVYRFLTPSPGKIRAVEGLDAAREVPGVLEADVTRKAGEMLVQVRCGPDRPGWIVTAGETRDAAITASLAAEARIIFEYAENEN